MFKDLALKTRSYRRFDANVKIERALCEELVDSARISASGANRQPLKYMISCDAETNATIFPNLSWAGYLKSWTGPSEDKRPTAYIIILHDTSIAEGPGCAHGIAAQTLLLAATEKGLGGCMIGSIKKNELRQALHIDAQYEILLVIALGKPAETVVLEEVGADGDIQYWRDENGVHHVPKRRLQDVIIN
jgi:nitroreductase